jgi:hypothetical protein
MTSIARLPKKGFKLDCFEMKYFKIQTNRATIIRLHTQFQSFLKSGEQFIAPRPLPRELMKFYYALVCVRSEGKNIEAIMKFKNVVEISKQNYEEQKSLIKYSWSVTANDA